MEERKKSSTKKDNSSKYIYQIIFLFLKLLVFIIYDY